MDNKKLIYDLSCIVNSCFEKGCWNVKVYVKIFKINLGYDEFLNGIEVVLLIFFYVCKYIDLWCVMIFFYIYLKLVLDLRKV